ncbi:MAG: DUF885 family protein, partial [bacterium]
LKVTMMLEAIPSHYQIWSEKLEKIPILARAFPDQIFINAWPYYFAFLMLNAGFEGYDPELRYMLLRTYVRILLVARVEILYHLQKLSFRQGEQLLLKNKLFKTNETNEVLEQINYSPGESLTIYWGVRQLRKLEQDCRKKLGPQFNVNDFFHYILEQGPIPIELIKQKVIQKVQSNRAIN